MTTKAYVYLQLRDCGYKAARALRVTKVLMQLHRDNLERWEATLEAGYPPSDSWGFFKSVGLSICGPHASDGVTEVDYIDIDGYVYAIH